MLIGVVSDTHAQIQFVRQAVCLLESFPVELVLHCGDIGSPEIVSVFRAWPTHFVFGNVDSDRAGLRRAITEAGQTCHERFGSLELAGRKIAFLHGDDTELLRQTAESGDWDLVCYGHTHQAREHHEGRTLLLNPGALYRATPHTLSLVQLPELEPMLLTV